MADRFGELMHRMTSSAHLARLLVLLGTVLTIRGLGTTTFVMLLALAGISLISIVSVRMQGLWLRHPSLALLDATLCVLLVVSSQGAPVATFVPLVTAAVVGVTLPLGLASPVLLVLVVSLVVPVLIAPQLGEWRPILLAGLPATAVGLALVGAVGRWALQEARRASHQSFRALRQAAASEHQAQLARDLHDGAGKSLHGIGLLAAALSESMQNADPGSVGPSTQRLATQIEHAASEAASEVRGLLSGLRLGTSDLPLPQLMGQLVAEGQEHGLAVELTDVDVVDLDPRTRRELWMASREVFHNAVKHARASTISIAIREADDGGVQVVVADDGIGLDGRRALTAPARGHYGLQGVKERIESVGGNVKIRSGRLTSSGRGTEVSLEVPR